MHIDLSRNKLTDGIFNYIIKLIREGKLSNINLSHNEIALNETNGFLSLLKQAKIAYNFDLSYNKLTDYCI